MQSDQRQPKTASVLELFFRTRSLVFWGIGLALLAQHLSAQPRPVMRYPKRDFLAGRLVLVPANSQPDALALPRQLAQIADHELRTPPVSLLETAQPTALNEWLRAYDFAEADGLLVAVDNLGASAAATLQAIRARHRHLSIYGFGQSAAAQILLADDTLDFLLVTGTNTAAEIKATDRIGYLANDRSAASVLLARWLNHRFGFAPVIAPIFSSTGSGALASTLARNVAALGGNIVNAAAADLRVFVHTPQTSETDRALLVSAIANNTANGLRCALIDAADNADERAALFKALRERKLLDRLAAYATVNANAPAFADACQRALTQANLWLIALKFLRDDTERVRRTERNQIAALLSAYLREAVYPTLSLEPGGTLEQREARAQAALRPPAETLFNEQFKRNVHALLLNTGERAEFELRLLQRLQIRLHETTDTPEIRTDVNLVLLGGFMAAGLPRAGWELNNAANLDARLVKRFDALPWQTFKTDAANVTLTIKLTNAAPADAVLAQGYALNSRRAGETRRITINAATAQGAFYALAQLEHLGASGQLAQDFQFTEKPAVAERGYVENPYAMWSQRERIEMLRLAGRARLNVFVYSFNDNDAARVRELNQTASDNFVTLVNAPARFTLQPCAATPLGGFALAVPVVEDKPHAIACAPVFAPLARLPLAWFGAYGWSGKLLSPTTTLAVTLNWLYAGKTREGLRLWLETDAQTFFAALIEPAATEINAPLLAEKLAQLQATLPQFDTTREQGLLRGVLRAFLQDAQQRLTALAENGRYERTETGVYRRRNP